MTPSRIFSAEAWETGCIKARSQNIARWLAEMPANHMTPTIFAAEAKKLLSPLGIEVIAHDKAWIEKEKMGGVLAVTKGSAEPPVFLELTYKGIDTANPSIAFVGELHKVMYSM
jgi:aminopeptidase